jgi:hypothetical protein
MKRRDATASVPVPEQTRVRITAAINKYAAAHNRPMGRIMLRQAAECIMQAGTTETEKESQCRTRSWDAHVQAYVDRFLTDAIATLLHDLLKKGFCQPDAFIPLGNDYFTGAERAIETQWQQFATPCEQVVCDEIIHLTPHESA